MTSSGRARIRRLLSYFFFFHVTNHEVLVEDFQIHWLGSLAYKYLSIARGVNSFGTCNWRRSLLNMLPS